VLPILFYILTFNWKCIMLLSNVYMSTPKGYLNYEYDAI